MTTKEKKEYGALGAILVITFVVIYFNFLKPKPAQLHPVNLGTAAGVLPAAGSPPGTISGPTGATPTSSMSATPTGSAISQGSLLPNGSDLNLKVLDNEYFKKLNPPIYPVVTKEEIGSTNIFSK